MIDGKSGSLCINGVVLVTTYILLPLSILSEENLSTANLESLAALFHRHFSKQDGFRILSAVVMLLQMKDLLPGLPQRIAALFLLYEVYRSDGLSATPFTLFFAELLQPSMQDDRSQRGLPCGYGLSQVEVWFLSQLLATSIPRDVSTTVSIVTLLLPLIKFLITILAV